MNWALTLNCPVPWCRQPATPVRRNDSSKTKLTVRYRCWADHRFSMDRAAIDQLTIDKLDVEQHRARVLAETTAKLTKTP